MELRLRDHLAKLFNEQKKSKKDVRENLRAMAKLLKEAQRLKTVLSANAEHVAQVLEMLNWVEPFFFFNRIFSWSKYNVNNLQKKKWHHVKIFENVIDLIVDDSSMNVLIFSNLLIFHQNIIIGSSDEMRRLSCDLFRTSPVFLYA